MKHLFLMTLVLFGGAQASSMAFVKADGVWLEQNGKAAKVAGTQGAQVVALSPRDGTLIYFVGKPISYSGQDSHLLRGFISKAPYTRATPLPAPLNALDIYSYNLEWTQDGSYVQAGEYRFDPRLGKIWKTAESRPRAASKSGAVSAWLEDYKILKVAGGKSKSARAAFNPNKLAASLAVTQKTLGVDADMYKDVQNWWTGDPAVSPDGQAIYFSSNGGGSGGAAGNTQYALFKIDSATDRIVALPKPKQAEGDLEGRLPSIRVSPDGKKLLLWSSVHSSAAENPSFLSVNNLLNARSVSLEWEPQAPSSNPKAQYTNWVTAACWLDPNTVALTGALVDISYFYGDHPEVNTQDPRYPNDVNLYLLDAVTGKVKRTVQGVGSVSCG